MPPQGGGVKRERESSDDAAPPPPKRPEPTQPTHMVLCIDSSGSMSTRDVYDRNGRNSRWSAVFSCAMEMVAQPGDVVISLITFGDVATTRFTKLRPAAAIAELRRSVRDDPPRYGTNFSRAFKKVEEVVTGSQKVMIVFLSDGRPGDLRANPPRPGEPLQSHYRDHHEEHESLLGPLTRMQRTGFQELNLQFVGIHVDGFAWLEYLAAKFGGTFHKTKRSMDDDDDVQCLGTKSASQLVAERQALAKQSNNVVDLVTKTSGSTSLRTTFQSISQTLTNMSSSTPLVERPVSLAASSSKFKFVATKMALKSDGSGFAVAPKELTDGRVVHLAAQPFNQGALRNVNRMTEIDPRTGHYNVYAAKESRYEVQYKDRLAFHKEATKCQQRTAKMATAFHAALGGRGAPPITVLSTAVYRLRDANCPGGFRYLSVEPMLDGKYQKFNDNTGNVLKDPRGQEPPVSRLAQAFSHFSYEFSHGTELVCDLQGIGTESNGAVVLTLTDPQLHSTALVYGRADCGHKGIQTFFKTHSCSNICSMLHLPTV